MCHIIDTVVPYDFSFRSVDICFSLVANLFSVESLWDQDDC